jgi:pre-rRNA-processing protein TSR4
MVLLLQLNGELPERFPGHERRLYIFSCRRKSCRRREGSTKALRGVKLNSEVAARETEQKKQEKTSKESVQPAAAASGLGEALFGVKPTIGGGAPLTNPFSSSSSNPNPFAKPSSQAPSNNPFAKPVAQPATETLKSEDADTAALPKTFAETLSLNNPQSTPSLGPAPPPEPWPAESDMPPTYPVSWLSDAEYETLDPTPMPGLPPASASGAMDVDSGEGSGGSNQKEDKEVFESSMDSTFQRFADRVGQNPDQCIRYEFAGVPLLYAKGDAVEKALGKHHGDGKVVVASGSESGMPRCGNCGAGRLFEVQLMPKAIEELEREEDGLDGMDWGTVIVGVCEKDCVERGQKVGETGYIEEWVGVQWEELTMKR